MDVEVIYLYDCGHHSIKPEIVSNTFYEINKNIILNMTLPGICTKCDRPSKDDNLNCYVRIVQMLDYVQYNRDQKLKDLGI